MADFLLYIGIYNVIGALLLMFMNSEIIADKVLRKYTEIINIKYSHGPFSKLWLWWAASSNLFLGIIMILSTRWNEQIQKEVIMIAIGVYVIMYLVMIFGAKKPKYGRGIIVTHLLWIFQITWGSWTLMN